MLVTKLPTSLLVETWTDTLWWLSALKVDEVDDFFQPWTISCLTAAKIESAKNTAIVNSFPMEGTVQVTRGQLRRHMRAKRVGRMLRRAKRVGRMSILFQWRPEKDRQSHSVAGAGAIRRAGPGKFQTTANLLLH